MGAKLALIGDLIGSRTFPDRERLQTRLLETLDKVNRDTRPLRELQITIGDEFQGTYERIADGLDASLQIRLELKDMADVRFGLGWGEVKGQKPRESSYGEDGPAWWNAREALEELHKVENRPTWPSGWRTRFKCSEYAEEGILNAFLLCRDEIVHGMDEVDARITLELIRGATQAEVGARLGISQSAVSQRLTRKGAFALLRSNNTFQEVGQWAP